MQLSEIKVLKSFEWFNGSLQNVRPDRQPALPHGPQMKLSICKRNT